MDYKAYRLKFEGAVRFGSQSLENGCYTFCADTLFSALCQEALKMGECTMQEFYGYAKKGMLLLSDAFPYAGGAYYLPKPAIPFRVENAGGDSATIKAYKKLKYIPMDAVDDYLSGRFDALQAPDPDKAGGVEMKVSASVRGEEETKPYRVQTYYFYPGNGLYLIIGYADQQVWKLTETLLHGLSFSGIGGKKSSGMGRFSYSPETLAPSFRQRLGADGKKYLSLSISLPRDDELEHALMGAQYTLCKRSGFVDSSHYAKGQMRKRDLYALQAGSCFLARYEGDIYDVSGTGGHHPVYRYAKPMFMGVDA